MKLCKGTKKLLEVGLFIFQNQLAIQKVLGVSKDIFKQELQLILEIISMDMGIMQALGKTMYISNTDHYEILVKQLEEFYNARITINELLDYILTLRAEEVYFVTSGGVMRKEQSTDIINKLFDLKYRIQANRSKFDILNGNQNYALRIEKKILSIALEELGDKRYFNTTLHA